MRLFILRHGKAEKDPSPAGSEYCGLRPRTGPLPSPSPSSRLGSEPFLQPALSASSPPKRPTRRRNRGLLPRCSALPMESMKNWPKSPRQRPVRRPSRRRAARTSPASCLSDTTRNSTSPSHLFPPGAGPGPRPLFLATLALHWRTRRLDIELGDAGRQFDDDDIQVHPVGKRSARTTARPARTDARVAARPPRPTCTNSASSAPRAAPWLRSLIAPAPDACPARGLQRHCRARRRWSRSTWRPPPSPSTPTPMFCFTRRRLARTPIAPARLPFQCADLADALPTDLPSADAIFAGNFLHRRTPRNADLLAYFAPPGPPPAPPPSVLVCDTFAAAACRCTGAPSAPWSLARRRSNLPSTCPRPACASTTPEQAASDPLTSRVVCRLHFRVEQAGEITHEFPRRLRVPLAFVEPARKSETRPRSGLPAPPPSPTSLPSHEVFLARRQPCLAILTASSPSSSSRP